jgi:zinc transporter ZupT
MILFFTLVLEFFASLLGPLFTRKTSAEGLHLWIAFAAGTVISVAIIHMLPESVEQSEFAPIAFLF